MFATALPVIVFLFPDNVLLGAAVWRSGALPRWAGGRGPLGRRGRVRVSLGYRARDSDPRRPEQPANGARGRVAGSDRRGLDGLERPSPTLRADSGRPTPTRGAITPA